MGTIKSFTDISQSKKLAKILPLESADMYYWCADHYPKEDWIIEVGKPDDNYECICAWSLSALLRLIPTFNMFKRTIECRIETTDHVIDKACDPIDAAFEMICWLKENNKL